METINVDTRNYDLYQFWGNIIDGTGFFEPDFDYLSLDEKAELVTGAIEATLTIVDYDGVAFDHNQIKRYATSVLENRNN